MSNTTSQKLAPSHSTSHLHGNILDEKLTPEQRKAAEHTIALLDLSGLTVSWIPQTKSLRYAKDRRVVTVPYVLYENDCWTDIRHLFRAILDKAPAVGNRCSPNEWGPIDDPMDDRSIIEQK